MQAFGLPVKTLMTVQVIHNRVNNHDHRRHYLQQQTDHCEPPWASGLSVFPVIQQGHHDDCHWVRELQEQQQHLHA